MLYIVVAVLVPGLAGALLALARTRTEVQGWKRQSGALVEANRGLAEEHARVLKGMRLDMDGAGREIAALREEAARLREDLERSKWGESAANSLLEAEQKVVVQLDEERQEAWRTIGELRDLLDRKAESLSRARAEKAKVHAQLKTAEIKLHDLRNELRIVKNDYDQLEALLQEGAGAS